MALCPSSFPDRYTPERKDYAVLWAARLEAGEAIASANVTVETGDIVVSDIDWNANTVTFWLTDGSPVYQRLAISIVTTATPPRTFQIEATITCYP